VRLSGLPVDSRCHAIDFLELSHQLTPAFQANQNAYLLDSKKSCAQQHFYLLDSSSAQELRWRASGFLFEKMAETRFGKIHQGCQFGSGPGPGDLRFHFSNDYFDPAIHSDEDSDAKRGVQTRNSEFNLRAAGDYSLLIRLSTRKLSKQ